MVSLDYRDRTIANNPFIMVLSMKRRQSIPENRVDLEKEIRDSDRQLRQTRMRYFYECGCGRIFNHVRVPMCCVPDLRCPACKADLTEKARELTE